MAPVAFPESVTEVVSNRECCRFRLPEQVILPTPALAKEMDLNVTLSAMRVEPE
jgi:hypothetical protein